MTEATTTIENTIRQEAADREAADRANKIAGLRKLAELLEENPSLELPNSITTFNVSLAQYREVDDETANAIKASLAATAKTLVAAGVKAEKDYSESYFTLKAELAPGITYEVYSDREIVCERKVVGTKKVLKPIMSEPQLTYQVGTEEVDEEIVEWECGSLLGGAPIPDHEDNPAEAEAREEVEA